MSISTVAVLPQASECGRRSDGDSNPTIVDPAYETLFEDGVTYAKPGNVKSAIDELLSSPAKYRKQSNTARKLVEAKFSLATYPARLLELCDDLDIRAFPALNTRKRKRPDRQKSMAVDRAERCSPRANGPRRRVLFVATNG